MPTPDSDAYRIAQRLIRRRTTTPADVDLYLRHHVINRHIDPAFARVQEQKLFPEVCEAIETAVIHGTWVHDGTRTLAEELREHLGEGETCGKEWAAEQIATFVQERVASANHATWLATEVLTSLGKQISGSQPPDGLGLLERDPRHALLRIIENGLTAIKTFKINEEG